MRRTCFLLLLLTLACSESIPENADTASITSQELRADLVALAGDSTEGRATGSEGYRKAARYAISRLERMGAQPVFSSQDKQRSWLQPVPLKEHETGGGDPPRFCSNVAGMIPGQDPGLADEWIVVSAHLDHLGRRDGLIYNGANDNAAGCAVVLEALEAVARSPLKRSVLALLTTGEEVGHLGSLWFVAHLPIAPEQLKGVVVLEHLGRPGERQDRLEILAPTELQSRLREANPWISRADLIWSTLASDPSGKIRGSDTDSFVQAGLPTILLGGGGFPEYHTPEDDPERIDYDYLRRSALLTYAVVLTLAQAPPAS